MKISIGIDPGYQTGITAWDGEGEKIIYLRTAPRDSAMLEVNTLVRRLFPHIVCIGVEVPTSKRTHQRRGQSVRAMKKIAHNVGDCYRAAMDLYLFCKTVFPGIPVYKMSPGSRKPSKAIFEYLTGYSAEKVSSSHSRDAGRIAQRAFDRWQYDNLVKEASDEI